MGHQVAPGLQPEQEVEDAAVAQIDLGGLDLPLTHVLEPRREHPGHESSGQQVSIAVCGLCAHVHRTRQGCGVPSLAVDVRQHPPETAQRLGRHLRAEAGHVALQERAREGPHPPRPGGVRSRQVRTRETAAHPEPVQVVATHLVERESAHVHERYPPGQRLRDAPHQVPRGAPGQQKHRPPGRIVAYRAQHFEERGHSLDFVHDHEPFASTKDSLGRRGQGAAVGGRLQVEDRGRVRPRRRDLPGQRRLAGLAGTQQRRHGDLGETPGGGRTQPVARQKSLQIGRRGHDIQR